MISVVVPSARTVNASRTIPGWRTYVRQKDVAGKGALAISFEDAAPLMCIGVPDGSAVPFEPAATWAAVATCVHSAVPELPGSAIVPCTLPSACSVPLSLPPPQSTLTCEPCMVTLLTGRGPGEPGREIVAPNLPFVSLRTLSGTSNDNYPGNTISTRHSPIKI